MKKTSRRSEAEPVEHKKLRLLFVGEGPHDVGRDVEGQRGGALAGFLFAALVGPTEACSDDEWPFEVVPFLWTRLTQQAHADRSKRRSFKDVLNLSDDGRRVRAAILLAQIERLDGVVVIRDCEQRGRDTLGDDLRRARTEYEAAERGPRPACVIATPSRAHETWLLADGDAVEALLGRAGRYHFAKDPEDRPDADTLKDHIRTHAARCHLKDHEVRRELAFRGRPDELERRCPKQYPAFRKDVAMELRSPMS